MAAIDKTYVSTFEEWKEIIDWARNKVYLCPNGIVFNVIDYCYYPDYSEDDIKEWLSESPQIPVMNTPTELDYFLIKDCPIKVIQDRLKEVYDEEFIKSILAGTSEFDTFVRPTPGKHLKFIMKPKGQKPISWYNGYLHRKMKGFYFVSVDSRDFVGYNEKCDKWIMSGELGNITIGGFISVYVHSLKALIRKIKSWKLPIGTRIWFEGYWVGEEGEIIITK